MGLQCVLHVRTDFGDKVVFQLEQLFCTVQFHAKPGVFPSCLHLGVVREAKEPDNGESMHVLHHDGVAINFQEGFVTVTSSAVGRRVLFQRCLQRA